MPFDITLFRVMVLLTVICAWVALSYATYRYLASLPLEDRNWVDRTRSRFVLLVIGYLFWDLGDWMKDEILRRWSRTSAISKRRRAAAQKRRQAFLSDSSD